MSITTCAEPGCPEDAVDHGRCRQHRKLVTGTGSRGSTAEWRRTRKRILARDGHRCTEIVNGVRCTATTNLHVDHVQPKAHGGGDEDENLATRCETHNLAKGANR